MKPPQTGQSQLSIPSPNEPAAPAAEPNRPIAEPNVAAATADVNVPEKAGEASREGKVKSLLGIRIKHASWLIRFADIVFIFAATLYCLTMLFILKVSLIGRLGGISHICRAFFLSMVMLVLILPWQKFFGSVVVGATYPPHELLEWLAARTGSRLSAVLFYLRFVGYWVLILLLLILSQLRSCRWTKAILRRLEVI